MTPLLTETEAARILRVTPACLRAWRYRGGQGPKYRKIGGAVRYHPEDLRLFVAGAARTSTSDPGPDNGDAE